MEACFRFDLRDQVRSGLVTVGRFDGEHPCLACATKTGKILIHDPYHQATKGDGSTLGSDVRYLSFQKQITSLASGAGNAKVSKDILFVGSETDLLAYDVERNVEEFHKDMPDGVFALAHGAFGSARERLVFAGGNCSIMGFDSTGKDKFWTVLGDNVCAMTLCDLAGQGDSQLLVGAEDQEMRVYVEGGDLLHEYSETEAVVDLVDLGGGRFAYALKNGTVGTYDGAEKSWRVKMAATPVALVAYDMTMDGSADLVIGWSDGTVEVRSDRLDGGGEIIAKDKLSTSIAGLVVADYRMDGTSVLLAVSVKGEVRGYLPLGVKLPTPSPTPAATVVEERTSTQSKSDIAHLKTKLEELERQKRDLIAELEAFNQKTDGSSSSAVVVQDPELEIEMNLLSSDHILPVAHLQVTFTLGIDAAIAMVVMQADALFEEEMFVAYEDKDSPSRSIEVAVLPPNNTPYKVACKVSFGPPGANLLQIHELILEIPAFSMFQACDSVCGEEECVRLPLNGKAFQPQFNEWLELNFLAPQPVLSSDGVVNIRSLRDDTSATVKLLETEIVVCTQSMQLAGDLVQSFLQFFKVNELNSVAAFPTEIGGFRTILSQINDLQSVRLKLSADLAEKSNLSKGYLFQAEDARLLRDHGAMKTSYRALFNLNRDMMAQYRIRCTNHKELLEMLKSVNQFIQCASRLRAGKAKAAVVHGCRQALQDNNVERIVKVVELGCPP